LEKRHIPNPDPDGAAQKEQGEGGAADPDAKGISPDAQQQRGEG